MNPFSDWLGLYFDQVSPREFYRTVFPEGELDVAGAYESGKYSGIIVQVTRQKKTDGKPKIKRYQLLDDLEAVERVCASDDFCLCSPLSYAGKNRTAENARNMYAIAVDLDKIRMRDGEPVGLINLWNGHVMQAERLPRPTFIVSSGTGLHLYYVMEQAIPLFPDVAKKLQAFKRELTRLVWNESIVEISDPMEVQQEGIYQGFRMPGTITKSGDRAVAFQTGEKVTLDYLNEFVDPEFRVDRFAVKSSLTKKQAQAKYPDWYERRVVNQEPRGVWHVSRNLYEWWLRKIKREARVGHRYYCLMMLAIYARKCSMYDERHNPDPVTREELEEAAFEVMRYFESLTVSDDNHFDESDVLDALEAFDDKWLVYPRSAISYKSGIEIEPSVRRNGQKQEWHLEDARAKKERMKRRGQEFKRPEGRPNVEMVVHDWQRQHPDGTKKACMDETGLSRSTVYKYWE